MARRFPSGLKASAVTFPSCLILSRSSPLVTFRISTSPEPNPRATERPSGLNWAESTPASGSAHGSRRASRQDQTMT